MDTIYSEAIDKLKGDLFKNHPENEKIYNLIEGLRSMEKPKETLSYTIGEKKPTIIKMVFDKNATAMEQILFALRYLGRIGKSPDIVDAIKEFDPNFDKGVSAPFGKLREIGQICVYNPTITPERPEGSNHQVYYGLKDWFVGENQVKEEYLTEELRPYIP